MLKEHEQRSAEVPVSSLCPATTGNWTGTKRIQTKQSVGVKSKKLKGRTVSQSWPVSYISRFPLSAKTTSTSPVHQPEAERSFPWTVKKNIHLCISYISVDLEQGCGGCWVSLSHQARIRGTRQTSHGLNSLNKAESTVLPFQQPDSRFHLRRVYDHLTMKPFVQETREKYVHASAGRITESQSLAATRDTWAGNEHITNY